MSTTLRRVHGRFALFWNALRAASGHMWQNRYYSCPIQPARIWPVIRYVEMNPIRASIVGSAVTYQWSSAAAHSKGKDASGLLDMAWWRSEWSHGSWRDALRAEFDKPGLDAIRRATFSGRPLGDEPFVASLEDRLERKLAPLPGGRPKKAAAAAG